MQTLYGSHSAIQTYITRIVNYLRNGKVILPVFGAGGAGKSTIGQLLSGDDSRNLSTNYDESWAKERHALPGDIPGYVLVAPGQVERTERHWPELVKHISSGHSPLILNVVAAGYHSLAVPSYKDNDVYKTGQTAEEFLDTYTRTRREVEHALLDKLLGAIRHVDDPIHLITVVNKQDLWYNSRNEVRQEYIAGPYGQSVDSFSEQVGKKSFQHDYIAISSVVANLVTPSNEVLAKTCAGYEQQTHLRHLQTFFAKINSILEEAVR